jgi:hypothetical protein
MERPMDDMNPEKLNVNDLLRRAMMAHGQAEQGNRQLLSVLRDPGNGQVIHRAGGLPPLRVGGPSDRAILTHMVQNQGILLQTIRLLFAALEFHDSQHSTMNGKKDPVARLVDRRPPP